MKLILQIILIILFTISVHAQIEYSNYQSLLKTYVDESGLVSYGDMANDKLLEKTVKQFATVEWKTLPEKSKLAFLINTYNLFAIKNVVDNYPIGSPMEVDDFFQEEEF